MAILVTGGAGYIGSHICVELLQHGYEVVVADNLSNSSFESIKRVKAITGKDIKFYQIDILEQEKLNSIFSENIIEGVVHLAGLKVVGESVQNPLQYYKNNLIGTLVLCEVMHKHNVKKIVFSSSATVYGVPKKVPISEDFSLGATNPYGRTKLMVEEVLRDYYISDPNWSIVILRYFNPIGAHPSGNIGEDPSDIPNNLMPYITQVAVGKLTELTVFGNDYPTVDGTGVRDYIHIVDLAEGHMKALEKTMTSKGIEIYNLGTGIGYSVLEIIAAFEKVSGRKIPYKFAERRAGDIAICYANPLKAKMDLGWVAKRGIEDMCADSWNWQSKNMNGYS
ncbi:UDP-glucose 4-epimerase GalE [Peribacillus asahii]|uniref:UDP-glucose 4-epimerase GalE n=1 Tax=Peribacillus asahii TaxID=228899 RepID=UPI0020795A16|nr:UDP-glucose 4-epimerase GalE [Peribacillus asahii]USK60095.1 UDP-glucose 4-epimerase GalE [Peribacillus asahii]